MSTCGRRDETSGAAQPAAKVQDTTSRGKLQSVNERFCRAVATDVKLGHWGQRIMRNWRRKVQCRAAIGDAFEKVPRMIKSGDLLQVRHDVACR